MSTCVFGCDLHTGDEVVFRKKISLPGAKDKVLGDERYGVVTIHWHYDGCVIDVEERTYAFLGPKVVLHPQFGDEVRRADRVPILEPQ